MKKENVKTFKKIMCVCLSVCMAMQGAELLPAYASSDPGDYEKEVCEKVSCSGMSGGVRSRRVADYALGGFPGADFFNGLLQKIITLNPGDWESYLLDFKLHEPLYRSQISHASEEMFTTCMEESGKELQKDEELRPHEFVSLFRSLWTYLATIQYCHGFEVPLSNMNHAVLVRTFLLGLSCLYKHNYRRLAKFLYDVMSAYVNVTYAKALWGDECDSLLESDIPVISGGVRYRFSCNVMKTRDVVRALHYLNDTYEDINYEFEKIAREEKALVKAEQKAESKSKQRKRYVERMIADKERHDSKEVSVPDTKPLVKALPSVVSTPSSSCDAPADDSHLVTVTAAETPALPTRELPALSPELQELIRENERYARIALDAAKRTAQRKHVAETASKKAITKKKNRK
ncbi:MAG: hypothetical protein Q4D57_01700 [Clostridia bacterium]|nr:hypothetical protein [Clostridia bacterium]